MVSNSMNMDQLYQQEADQDGFLYMVYTSQPAFGSIKWKGEEFDTSSLSPYLILTSVIYVT